MIQKLKKQGHFLPEEDDKFLERVRAAVVEEERQTWAAADTDAARDDIATAEESRKAIQNSEPFLKDVSYDDGVIKENENQQRAKTKWWLVITLTMDLKGMVVLGYVMWQSYRWNSIPTIMAAILTLAHLLRFEERVMHTSDQKEVVFQGIRFSHLRRRMKYGHLTQGGLNDT